MEDKKNFIFGQKAAWELKKLSENYTIFVEIG